MSDTRKPESVSDMSDLFDVGDKSARQSSLAEYVIKRGSVLIADLPRVAGTSLMTVYRDIAALEEEGVLCKRRGKAVALATSLNEAGVTFRINQKQKAKRAIAARAAKLISSDSIVSVDDSTTSLWVLRELEALGKRVTVVTNSLTAANEVITRTSNKLLLAGGEYEHWAAANFGAVTVESLSRWQADICVISTSGYTCGKLQHPTSAVAEVKMAMLKNASERVLVADSSKFTRQALNYFAHVRDFEYFITDSATPSETRDEIRGFGTNLIIA